MRKPNQLSPPTQLKLTTLNASKMDFLKNAVAGGNNNNNAAQGAGQPVDQQQSSGGGGLMGKMNSALGGGQASEKNEGKL